MNTSNIKALSVIIGLLICAAVATYIVSTVPNDAANSEAKKSLAVAPDVTAFTDLEGNPITFKEYEGKIRVVNSWASWTPFSAQELKDLEVAASEHKEDGIIFIAINRKEPKEYAKKYLESLGEFKNIIFAIDLNDTFYTSVGGFSMPETVFYDAKGAIVFHKHGSMDLGEIRTHIAEVLQASK